MSVPTTFLQENLKERDVLADSCVEMRTILKYIFDKVHEYGKGKSKGVP